MHTLCQYWAFYSFSLWCWHRHETNRRTVRRAATWKLLQTVATRWRKRTVYLAVVWVDTHRVLVKCRHYQKTA